MSQADVFKGGEMRPLPSPTRTEGDGMENSETTKTENKVLKRDKFTLGDKLIYRPQDYKQYSPSPPLIVGKVVNLVPKNVIKLKKDTKILDSLKSKEPKFVPYEPYKAAVKSMIPLDKKNRLDRFMSKKHIPEVPSLSAKPEDKKVDSAEAISLERKISLDLDVLSMKNVIQELETERESFILELKTLKEENTQLESQLKFQAQVNGELKALLVAAVGEDLEVRVNHLTEDKLQLARALLNSAQKLSTHQEQTEWLAGQCEVWRSKFLASSLMVEELARWKAALTQKTTDLQEALKRLLEERRVVRESLLHTHKNLSMLRENFEHGPCRRSALSSSNIVDLSAANRSLGEVLTLQLLGGHDRRACREPDMTGLEASTWAERAAETLLSSPSPLLLSDVACSAVLGAAVAVGSHGLPASCCAHCSGEIKLV